MAAQYFLAPIEGLVDILPDGATEMRLHLNLTISTCQPQPSASEAHRLLPELQDRYSPIPCLPSALSQFALALLQQPLQHTPLIQHKCLPDNDDANAAHPSGEPDLPFMQALSNVQA